MVEIKLDENEIRKVYREELDKHLKKLDNELLFWDTATLCKKTNLSINTIKELFFYDPDFKKFKVGNKWLYPADETKKFLLDWIERQ
ncbi:group-specific protein [Oceanobacillus caeni]|uniref:group-specific protein n=1 Tax=Oceanobacillus caeni TaxID=405946 RepID=UPI002149A31A|nr:group-specific protein [Oceanobacillus caeni]MCR1833169.1 group-specific protein [Oceanobacillus caeni]